MSEAATIRLEEVERFRRRLLELQVEYRVVQNAPMSEVYEALLAVGFEHGDEVAERIGGGTPGGE